MINGGKQEEGEVALGDGLNVECEGGVEDDSRILAHSTSGWKLVVGCCPALLRENAASGQQKGELYYGSGQLTGLPTTWVKHLLGTSSTVCLSSCSLNSLRMVN